MTQPYLMYTAEASRQLSSTVAAFTTGSTKMAAAAVRSDGSHGYEFCGHKRMGEGLVRLRKSSG